MASVLARLPASPLMVVNGGRQPVFGTIQKLAVPTIKERQDRLAVIAKATGESSDSSIVKSVLNWDKSEDRVALVALGFAGVVGFWASINLVTSIEKIPVVPSVLELIGLLFSSWFTYRYLLFKPDRQELSQAVSKSISDILGQ
ncbi:hypothetical protein ACP275_04G101600 [Erythranthe tilingii]